MTLVAQKTEARRAAFAARKAAFQAGQGQAAELLADFLRDQQGRVLAGYMPMRTEITPLLIITKLEQYDYAGATAVAMVMLVISFVLLLVINALQAWQRRQTGAAT